MHTVPTALAVAGWTALAAAPVLLVGTVAWVRNERRRWAATSVRAVALAVAPDTLCLTSPDGEQHHVRTAHRHPPGARVAVRHRPGRPDLAVPEDVPPGGFTGILVLGVTAAVLTAAAGVPALVAAPLLEGLLGAP
ncbi:hypothetical protein ACGFX4_03270 [Kitasatospora sp. NPDC048365]|uniref:hypothetical protein n=1 Tax=Kitasatospora sp. NPDC048365 TaxID=3364050 RepID=UPI003710A2F8